MLALSHRPMWPSPSVHRIGVPNWVFEAQYPARECLCLHFTPNLTIRTARLKVGMVFAIPFLQDSFIPCNMPVYPGAQSVPYLHKIKAGLAVTPCYKQSEFAETSDGPKQF